MAAAKVLSVAELLQNVLYMLTECDGKRDCTTCKSCSKWFKERMHHDPTLFSCLLVNSFWFFVAKHILWEAPYSIDLLLKVEQGRRQLYANSIRNLEVTLPHRQQQREVPEDPFDEYGSFTQNLERHARRLQQLGRLYFPRLQKICIVALADPLLISLLPHLPTGARHVCIRFAYDEDQLESHHSSIRRLRLGSARNDRIEYYEHTLPEEPYDPHPYPPRLTLSSLQSVLAYLHDCRSLKGLDLVDFPDEHSPVIWDCVSRMSQLEILEAKAIESWEQLEIFPEPAPHPQLSSLKSLRLEMITLSRVFGILRDTRNLESFQMRLEVDDSEGYPADDLLKSLSANRNLKHIEIAFSLYGDNWCAAPFILEEQSLLNVSERCQTLKHFVFHGCGQAHVSDETLFKFSQDLPHMEVFILPIITEATHQSLVSLSKHWPRLRRLDTYTFFDFGQVHDTEFFMPNLEELHIGLRTETQIHQAEPSSVAWKHVLNNLCPKLELMEIEYDHSNKISRPFHRPFVEHYIQRVFATDPHYFYSGVDLDQNGNPWPALPENLKHWQGFDSPSKLYLPTRDVESTGNHLSGPMALPSGQNRSIATVLGYLRRAARGVWGY